MSGGYSQCKLTLLAASHQWAQTKFHLHKKGRIATEEPVLLCGKNVMRSPITVSASRVLVSKDLTCKVWFSLLNLLAIAIPVPTTIILRAVVKVKHSVPKMTPTKKTTTGIDACKESEKHKDGNQGQHSGSLRQLDKHMAGAEKSAVTSIANFCGTHLQHLDEAHTQIQVC
eukprot:1156043-Pelagomonas_calceolata.AAC.9